MFAALGAYATLAKIGLVILVFALLGWFVHEYDARLIEQGHKAGMAEVQAQWNAEKSARVVAEAKALDEREKENAKQLAADTAAKEKEEQDHENAIASLNQKLDAARASVRTAGGLRVSSAICANRGSEGSAGAPETSSPGGSDSATAGTVALPDAVTDDLLDLAHEADAVTEQARSCKAFVIDHGFAQ